MITMSQNQLHKLKMEMGYEESTHNTHGFFRNNGIRLGFNFQLSEWNLHFETARKESLFRIQYSNIL